jgi:hypothetical protein
VIVEQGVNKNTIVIRDPGRLLLDGVYHGGDQEWYVDTWRQRAGCGPTTAATLLYYLAQRDADKQALWPTAPTRTREDFLQFMDLVWEDVTPGMRGLNRSVLFTDGVERLSARRGVALTAHVLEVPETIGRRKGFDHFSSFVMRGLRSDCPVAFLNLSNGKAERLHSWHWVTIVAARWDAEHPENDWSVTVFDEGKSIEIDLKCWYDTSLLGGALVWFD